MPGKFLAPLIEKQAMAVKWMRRDPVFLYIPLDEICCFGPEINHSETISLAENGQRFIVWIKEVEIQSSKYAKGSGLRLTFLLVRVQNKNAVGISTSQLYFKT